VLYDVLRKPAHRPSQAKSETPEAYGRRVLEAIAEDPERYYRRGLITRLENELDEARVDTWQTAVAIRDSRRLRVWPRNPDACVQWSRVCDYFAVCCGEQSIEDPVLLEKQSKKNIELDIVETMDDSRELLTQSSLRT